MNFLKDVFWKKGKKLSQNHNNNYNKRKLKNTMDEEKYCVECGEEIPEGRLNQKRKIKTCSKKCSNKRNTTASKKRSK